MLFLLLLPRCTASWTRRRRKRAARASVIKTLESGFGGAAFCLASAQQTSGEQSKHAWIKRSPAPLLPRGLLAHAPAAPLERPQTARQEAARAHTQRARHSACTRHNSHELPAQHSYSKKLPGRRRGNKGRRRPRSSPLAAASPFVGVGFGSPRGGGPFTTGAVHGLREPVPRGPRAPPRRARRRRRSSPAPAAPPPPVVQHVSPPAPPPPPPQTRGEDFVGATAGPMADAATTTSRHKTVRRLRVAALRRPGVLRRAAARAAAAPPRRHDARRRPL